MADAHDNEASLLGLHGAINTKASSMSCRVSLVERTFVRLRKKKTVLLVAYLRQITRKHETQLRIFAAAKA